MGKTLKLPINIVRAKGGYTVAMEIGSNQQVAHLLLDTGSSTIAVEKKAYNPADDFYLKPTTFVQAVTYGSGGWAGPLVTTHLQLESRNEKMTLKDTQISIIKTEQQDNFHGADGILGLGYKRLNKAYDLTAYYQERNIQPAKTYPWHFEIDANKTGIRTFKKFIRQYDGYQIKPFFTQLEEHKVSRNKFALYTKRSIVHVSDENMTLEELEQDELNQGFLILGRGEEHRELYHGNLEIIDVVHDAYYNTNLISMQVGDGVEIPAEPLDTNYRKSYFSNSIIDCGCSYNILQESLYQELLDQLLDINTDFIRHIDAFQQANQKGKGYFPTDLELSEWPDIHFYFSGVEQEKVKLTCTPDNYWQLNAIEKNRAYFMFMNELKNWPNMALMGLPLMSDYFCVFDREYDSNGVIKVGKVKL